jgi:hypothetical protein
MRKLLLTGVAVLLAFMALRPADAHRITTREIYATGQHWCNWSIAKTCSRWRANGNKSYGLGCTGPNDMRSGCIAERGGLR